QLVARRRRKAAKLDRRAVAADRADPDRLLVGKNSDEAVEIRQSLMVVIGVARTGNRLPQLVFLKSERPGAHDVLLEPMGVAVEHLFFVDEGKRIGERWDEGGRRRLEAEGDGFSVGRVHAFGQ